MPVIEHAVHPRTQIKENHRYGCWNRPDRFKKSYWAPHRRIFPDGSFELVSVRVPFVMSHDCRYDGKNGKAGDDPYCEGCRHYKKSPYLAGVMENGK